MIKYLLKRQIGRMEREFSYDASYGRELVDAAPWSAFLLFLLNGVSRRPREIPVEAWFAAKVAAAMHADCGPCTQLVVSMAARAGVSPRVLKALVSGRLEEVPEETREVFSFAREALGHGRRAMELRERLVDRYGRRATARLSFIVALAPVFPTLRSVMGRGAACVRVRVGDETVTAMRPATAGL